MLLFVILKNRLEKFVKKFFKGKFVSSRKVVLEEFLKGEEASYFLLVDKNNFTFMGSAQDHKRVGENERGPNTGGMGAYSPAPIISRKIEKKNYKKNCKTYASGFEKKWKPLFRVFIRWAYD